METKLTHIILIFLCLMVVTLLTSCSEDVITVDLNSVDPQIVIEGRVIEGSGPHVVVITKTTDYFEPSDFPRVENAGVIISDNAGNSATLVEEEPGLYTTSGITGVTGRTYTLTVDAEETRYTATSTMHEPSHIDSLSFEIEDETRDEEWYIVHCYFTDTEGIDEFYRFNIMLNNDDQGYYMYQDRLTDGNEIHYEMNVFDEKVVNGDIIVVEMQAIDRGVYEYFSTLGNASAADGSMGMFSGTPANPTTNMSGDALGYFSAYISRADTLVVEK